MDFLTLAKERCSVRKYDARPIEDEKIAKILEAAKVAPTAKNSQPFRIYIIKSPDAMAKLKQLTPCTFGAPLVFIVAYSRSEEWHNKKEPRFTTGVEDTSIVATHMMLEACQLGLGTCWVNMFPPMATAHAFCLPDDIVPVLLMPTGYAAPDARPLALHTQYRDMREIVHEL